MKKNAFLLIWFFLVFSKTLPAQSNEAIFRSLPDVSKSQNMGEAIVEIATTFIDQPYVAGSLEGPEEKLVCKLDGFDCYTFVENVLALAAEKKKNEPNFNNYLETLQNLRYHYGILNGYASRIHYFIDWAHQAEKNGYIKNLTPIFGVKSNINIFFMSKNSHLYPALKNNDSEKIKIVETEKKISSRSFYFIPKDHFNNYQNQIRNGDIIAFSSTIAGLDVNHEGFAYWQNGKLKLLHASQEKKKVIVSDETLGQYLQRISKHSGIIIYRPSN